MLDIVCWKWRPPRGFRSQYNCRHVNVLRAMVARHYQKPHRFSCITDDSTGIDPRVRVIPLWDDHSKLLSPHGIQNPSCYRRLRAFSREAADLIGPRFVSLDLDTVITGDMAPVWDRPEDFVIWTGQARPAPYNGSMFLMTAGARARVWEEFDPIRSPKIATALHYVGSDQAWIGACLGRGEATWSHRDGVYSWRMQLRPNRGSLPPDARVVFFHGSGGDPWAPTIQRAAPWVVDHWREEAKGVDHVQGQHVRK